MRRFEQRDRKMFALYTEHKMTLAAIGRLYGLSRERIRQIVGRIAYEEGINVQDLRTTGHRKNHNAAKHGG